MKNSKKYRTANRLFICGIPLVLIIVGFLSPVSVSGWFDDNGDTQFPSVGIWYSTWYANEGKYIWKEGHGIGSKKQMLGDVNGDGLDDAVVFFDKDESGWRGRWFVALSNGNGFDDFFLWKIHGHNSQKQMLGDVDGDGKDDVVAYYNSQYLWTVALAKNESLGSTGTFADRFGFGLGSHNQMLGDVDGDGKDDAVVFVNEYDGGVKGYWYVALSKGNGFKAAALWKTGHGYNSKMQMLGDVNGDGKDDAIVYFDNDGSDVNFKGAWYVAISNGNSFNNFSLWKTGHGIGSQKQMLGDVDNDGDDDAVVYFEEGVIPGVVGEWYVAKSNRNGFDDFSLWKYFHGAPNRFFKNKNPSSLQMIGNVNEADNEKNGSADAIAFYEDTGEWKVCPAEKVEPARHNLWEAFGADIRYEPVIGGHYDSKNTDVIKEHLKMLTEAGVDFLLFDLTNNVETPFIFDRAKVVSNEIKKWNEEGNPTIKFAVAIGGIQFKKLGLGEIPNRAEAEAEFVYTNFVNDHYYKLDGKPLLVMYGSDEQISEWKDSNNKPYTSNFTMHYAPGLITESSSTDHAPYFGWTFPNGSIANDDIMTVMPGWNNHVDGFEFYYTNRKLDTLNNESSYFYYEKGWKRVLSNNPNMVIIASFNEYAEENAVAPAYTNEYTWEEQWPSPDFYWDKTKQYICDYLEMTYSIPPFLSEVKAISSSEISLTWTKTGPAEGYDIYRKGPNDDEYQKIGSNITNTSYIDTHLSQGTEYKYKILKYNSTCLYQSDLDLSDPVSGKIMAVVPPPVINPNGGNYIGGVSVELLPDGTTGIDTSDADIYYTIDGSTPTLYSQKYASPFTLTSSALVKAIATKSGIEDSSVASAEFKIAVATPVIDPVDGSQLESVSVTLSTNTSGADIYYTINGSNPTQSSQKYDGPFTLTNNAAVKAIAFKNGMEPSSVASANVTVAVATPVINPNGGTHTESVSVELAPGISDADIYYTIDRSTPTSFSQKYVGPFILTSSSTVQAIAIKSGMEPSLVASTQFTIDTGTSSGGQVPFFDDIGDLTIIAASYGLSTGETGFNPDADLNNDGTVNILDLTTKGASFGTDVSYVNP